MKNKKLMLLSVLLLFTLLVSACSDSGQSDSETTAGTASSESVVTEPELKPDLPKADYNGRDFRMYIRDREEFIADMYVEEANGDLMNDAIYDRNTRVSEQFNVNFKLIVALDIYGGEADKVVLAGEDAYDLLVTHARRAFLYSQNGVTLDWLTHLKYINPEMPWWSQDAREAFALGGKLYSLVGDISYQNLGSSDAMLFNKEIFEAFNYEYPYKDVSEDSWTFDRFTALAKSAVSDLNGDSQINYTDDRLGYMTGWWIGPIQVLYSSGERICRINDDGEMYLTLNTPRTVECFERFLEFVNSDSAFVLENDFTEEIENLFASGRAMFMDSNIKYIMRLRGMDRDFGIVPWPKLNESVDKYYTNVDAGTNNFSVPITVSDTDMVSAVIEALAYEGYKDVIPTYYEVVLTTKYSRDEESIRMLDIIHEGRVFDIGYFYNGTSFVTQLNSIGNYLVREKAANFSSYYAQYEQAALEKIKVINEAYSG